jgi:hypothetical protein
VDERSFMANTSSSAKAPVKGCLASHCSGAAVDQTGALIASRSILRLVARKSKHG